MSQSTLRPAAPASPLGCPLDRAGHDTLAGRLLQRHPVVLPRLVDELARRREVDRAILTRSRRWAGREPDWLGPADVPAVRYHTGALHWRQLAGMTHAVAQRLHTRQLQRLGAELDALTAAVPYFLPVSGVEAIGVASRDLAGGMTQRPRLPFPRILVVLAEHFQVGGRSEHVWPDGLRQQLAEYARTLTRAVRPDAGVRTAGLLAAATSGGPRRLPGFWLPLYWLIEHGGAVAGVVLHSDRAADGRLADEVLWLLAINPPADTSPDALPTPVRTLIPGWLSQATLAALPDAVAASVHRSAWTPLELPLVTSEHRPAAPNEPAPTSGPPPSVRVLDLATPRRAPASEPTSVARPRARPASYERGPHTRRVRVGPRDNWHYELRDIPGRYVDTGVPPKRTTIRKLPAQAPTPDKRELPQTP